MHVVAASAELELAHATQNLDVFVRGRLSELDPRRHDSGVAADHEVVRVAHHFHESLFRAVVGWALAVSKNYSFGLSARAGLQTPLCDVRAEGDGTEP
jgi:hypothetical protein